MKTALSFWSGKAALLALLLGCWGWQTTPAAAQAGRRLSQARARKPVPVVRRPFALHDSLLYAAATGNTALARKLLRRGADVNGRITRADSLGYDETDGYVERIVWLPDWSFVGADNTPLGVAIDRGHLPLVDLLLAHGARAESELARAVRFVPHQLAVVRRLLAHGARPDSARGPWGSPVEQLIRYNADMRALQAEALLRRFETPAQRSRQRNRMGPRRDPPTPQPLRPDSVGLQLLRLLVEAGANPGRGRDYSSSLHLAAEYGELGLARYLATHGASVNAPDYRGVTPLHVAAQRAHPAMVRLLLAQGANPNAPTQAGNTPLHLAAAKDSVEAVVDALLRAGADVNSRALPRPATAAEFVVARGDSWEGPSLPPSQEAAGARFGGGETPLHRAAKANRPGTARCLLAAGAQVDALDESQRSPLQLAFSLAEEALAQEEQASRRFSPDFGQEEDAWGPEPISGNQHNYLALMQVLLDHGADLSQSSGRSLLRWALGQNDTALVRTSLQHGANPGQVDASGRTATAYVRSEPALRLLLAHGARVGPGPATSPLFNAGLEIGTVRASLAAGASALGIGPGGVSPLHQAVLGGNAEVAALYLAVGAPVEATDSSGYTPLALAARKGTVGVMSLLLANGARPDGQPAQRPLVVAAASSNEAAMQLLLRHAARPNLASADGTTPLQAALSAKVLNAGMVAQLLAAGADLHAPDSVGYSPLHRCLASHSNRSSRDWNNEPYNAKAEEQFLAVACLLLAKGANPATPNAAGESFPDALRTNPRRPAFQVLLREMGQPMPTVSKSNGW